jgi:hypothetical protein
LTRGKGVDAFKRLFAGLAAGFGNLDLRAGKYSTPPSVSNIGAIITALRKGVPSFL